MRWCAYPLDTCVVGGRRALGYADMKEVTGSLHAPRAVSSFQRCLSYGFCALRHCAATVSGASPCSSWVQRPDPVPTPDATGLFAMRSERPAVIASLSARVGSIGDNSLGGWHSYRASKSALNQVSSASAGVSGITPWY